MAEPLWTSDEVLAATTGRLAGAGFSASGVTFDTRELQPGDLFIALAGEGPQGFQRLQGVGKTSVTLAIAAGLRLAGPSHNSVKSFNNHIGVPLTLARMPRGTERAVFEIGMNHAEEIRPLSKMVQPHAVCVTTVGPVHIEHFPDG